MISGLIVTTMTDMGPFPLLNLSEISEDTTVKLSVIGMTILSMGAGSVAEKQHYRLHGSIPIPDSPNLEAIAMSFTVAPTKTDDVRIDQHGRESTIWLLFESKDRNRVFLQHSLIEKALKEEISTIHIEDNLSDPTIMNRVLTRIKEISQAPSRTEVPVSDEIPFYIPERGGLEFYTIDMGGDLVTLEASTDLTDHSVLILINSVIKRIFLIKLKDSAPQRLMFLASRSASNLNVNRFKSNFTIRNVSDPLEREMILEKIGIIQKIGI
ncbi:MAG: hypothetical protein JSV04_02865 [Candidatus Heimdallarchaeota archaeon]|nr:MAG: hypothetical protein JSV04_02865 [Candidatus Heimdallarchaeota archaeon]